MLSRLIAIIWALAGGGCVASDTSEVRLKKTMLTLIAMIIAVLAIFWGGLYFSSGYPLSGTIPLGYALISFISLAHFFWYKRFSFFCNSQLVLIFVLPFLLMWSLGGFANGSVVMVWAFFTPLAALFFANLRIAINWMIAFLVASVFSALIDPWVAARAAPMTATLNTVFFLMNMGAGFAVIFVVLFYFVREKESAQRCTQETLDKLEQAYLRLQQHEEKIRELMLTDALTGVANRRFLDERLQEELLRARRSSQSFSIILVDVDYFKQVNDRYGHTAGDKVLQEFAELLRRNLRTSDFVARFGGEEFMLILPDTTLEGAASFAERLRQNIQQTEFHALPERMTASFGVALSRPDDEGEALIKRADAALYTAKTSGRNQTVAARMH